MKNLVIAVIAYSLALALQKDVAVSASIFDMFRGSSSAAGSSNGKAVHPVVEDVHAIRGLPDHLIPQYQQEFFICDKGKTVLKPSQINDGYCDCKDGKDEPGTSACNQGTFYCRNKGYKIIGIPSSRVEDGVCDCCDASDEAPGVCPNTCQATANKERASLDRAINAFKVGRAQRKALINQAKEQLQSQANQLPFLEKEVERVRTEQNSVQQESDTYAATLSSSRQASLSSNQASLDKLLILQPQDLAYLVQFTQNLAEVLDLTSSQIDGMMTFRPVARSTGIHGEEEEGYGDEVEAIGAATSCEVTDMTNLPSHLLSGLCQVPSGQDVYQEVYHIFYKLLKTYRPYSEVFHLLGHYQLQGNTWTAEAVDYARNALVDHSEDVQAAPSDACPQDFAALPTEFCVLPEQMKTLLEPLASEDSAQQQDGTYLAYKQRLHTLSNELRDLERRRNEAATAQDTLHQQQATSSSFTDSELAFKTLKDQCFDVVDGKFSYSLCILSKVSQKEEHGNYNTVTLGSFERLEAIAPTSANQGATYVMHFENGQYCHAHGARKADVTIRCGEKHALLSAAEPSTCFYALQFESPVACTDEYAEVQGIAPYVNTAATV